MKVIRHGKVIAEIIPASSEEKMLSWKRPGLRLKIKDVSLSGEILKERNEE